MTCHDHAGQGEGLAPTAGGDAAGRPKLAVFAATSGHSGVDRVLKNLLPELAARGIAIDLLQIDRHGPHLDCLPAGVQRIPLGRRHVNTSLGPLVAYLRRVRPNALLTDKDKVNRLAIVGRWLAGVDTRVAVRIGTNVSTNLASRGHVARWTQRASIARLYRYADAIITPSQGAAEDLARVAGLAATRISVVPNPAVTASLHEQARAGAQHPWLARKTTPVILGIGELGGRKDFATLIRAFARVRRKRPVRLVILGEGKRRDELEALARALGVADDVALPGFFANPYAELVRADAFALTSVCEGAGMVLMEALALGVPCLATDAPSGPREILDDGRLGPVLPIGDDAGIAAALLGLLAQPTPRARLQAGARRYEVAASADAYLAALGLAAASSAGVADADSASGDPALGPR